MDFSSYRNKVILLFLLNIFSVFLLVLDSTGVINSLYKLSALVTNPIKESTRMITININNFTGAFTKLSTIEEENLKLKEENLKLTEELSDKIQCEQDYKTLSDQLVLKDIIKTELIRAKITSVDTAYENTIQINVGSDDGIASDDIVVYGKFAVGRIIEVTPKTSSVLLITSPTSKIPSVSETNSAKGLVSGSVGYLVKMSEILPDENIQIGEIIITTGVDSSYPSGLILGKVKEVKEDPGKATKQAIIEVQIDFSKLTDVYIIK